MISGASRVAGIDGLAGARAVGGLDWRQDWRFGITKAGNARARKALIESAWCYRFPARIGQAKLARVEAAPPAARRSAWKAQTRLTARYRALMRKGKLKTVAVTAVARELAGFIWAIHRALETEPAVA